MNIVPMKVTLIDSMGSDLSVVNAARVSFNKESEWEQVDGVPFGMAPLKREGTRHNEYGEIRLSEKDAKLISYLAKHGHWTPFAHAFLSFRIKAPIFVARQLVKHQVGLAWNEVSRRYVDDEPEFCHLTWRMRAENAKQGSAGEFSDKDQEDINTVFWSCIEACFDTYDWMIKKGVAPEQARAVLNLNQHTEWIWSGSLAAFARVCKLRLDSHAQLETGLVAVQINDLIPSEFEHSWKALINVGTQAYPTSDSLGKSLLG